MVSAEADHPPLASLGLRVLSTRSCLADAQAGSVRADAEPLRTQGGKMAEGQGEDASGRRGDHLAPQWGLRAPLPLPAEGRGPRMQLVHLAPLACRGRQESGYWLWARSRFGRPGVRGQGVGPPVGSFPAQTQGWPLGMGGGPSVLCDTGDQGWPVPISACAPLPGARDQVALLGPGFW